MHLDFGWRMSTNFNCDKIYCVGQDLLVVPSLIGRDKGELHIRLLHIVQDLRADPLSIQGVIDL